MGALLEVDDLVVDYGPIRALDHISLTVGEGELVALLGSNGAGKSTLLRTISGLVPATSGHIHYDGDRLFGSRHRPDRVARAGIAHVLEGRHIFLGLTVAENLAVGRSARSAASDGSRDVAEVEALFPILGERRNQRGWSLSGGEQQMLTIARSLMAHPRLLMLDEPSLGLAPMLARDVFLTIRSLREEGITVLLVEQNARAALRIADRGYVLENGKMVLDGSAEQLRESDRVRQAYLGA